MASAAKKISLASDSTNVAAACIFKGVEMFLLLEELLTFF